MCYELVMSYVNKLFKSLLQSESLFRATSDKARIRTNGSNEVDEIKFLVDTNI